MTDPKAVPHSKEAEEAVVGAVMINPDALHIEVSFLKPEDFYIHRNRWIWEAYLRLHSQGIAIDYVTVSEELGKMGHLKDIGGAAYLTKLMNSCPSSLHAESYAVRVQETAIRRHMIANANQEARDAYDEEKPLDESVAEAVTRLGNLFRVKDTARSMRDAAMDVMDIILERVNLRHLGETVTLGFLTGVEYIDRNIKGLSQAPGIYISLEMDEESMVYRLLSTMTGVDPTKIETGDVNATAVVKAAENINPNLGLWCTPHLTDQSLRSFLAKRKAEKGIGWAIVDYVDLMVPSETRRNETEEDKEIWNGLKKIALELDILLIGIESVNKLAADGVMTDDKVVGSYGKIHAVDVAFGYSPYHALPYKGCPEIEDPDRERRCRVLNVMADRHRECGGIVMPLEMRNNTINDLWKSDEDAGDENATEDEGGNWWDN